MAIKEEENDKKTMTEEESDVELEGVDMSGDEEMEDAERQSTAEHSHASDNNVSEPEGEVPTELEREDHDETEAARNERMELMAAEAQKTMPTQSKAANMAEQLEYLLAQSEVFAHFLAGTFYP